MQFPPGRSTERFESIAYLRPAAIFVGLATFLVGAVVLGSALAVEDPGRVQTFTGPIFLCLGVSLVGGGFVMEPSDHWLDPEIEFPGAQRYFVVAVSTLFLLVAGLITLFGG